MAPRKIVLFLVLILIVAAGTFFYSRMKGGKEVVLTPLSSPVSVSTPTAISPLPTPILKPSPVQKPIPPAVKVSESPIKVAIPNKPSEKPTAEHVQIAPEPPPVEIHKELIPKNIEIVRVYYANDLMGPGSSTDFDINGTGFTREFEKMITVVSGNPNVNVTNLTYVTLNQIRGTLVSLSTCPTSVGFPQILIGGKVVFRAVDPFAVIQPDDVLRVVFTDIGENGRTGRFRIYTNLTDDMFKKFSINMTTSAIQVTDMTPHLPFIVDATVLIGQALVGEYGMSIKLADKVLWDRPGAIRVVMPKVNESGLLQRLHVVDEFLRPGDRAYFLAQGSGFQPDDVKRLKVSIEGLPTAVANWTYVAPGRMNLTVDVSTAAAERSYGVRIYQDDKTLLQLDSAFLVVSKNWIKGLRFDPPLLPGTTSSLVLSGRDLEAPYVQKLSGSFDEEGLKLDKFQWVSATEARAPIAASASVLPGDYLLTIDSDGKPVQAFNGNVVTVMSKH